MRGRVKLLPNGPPVPYPVQFRVVGTEPAQLRAHADEVKAVMRENPNMRGVNDNWNESVKVMRLEVDQAKARALGVTSQAIAQASRTMFSGTTVGQFREDDKLIDIVLRQPLDEREAISDIGNAYLPTSSGQSIPLTQIAKPVFTWEPGVMWRENRDYAITVQGDIVEGLQGATVTEQLLPALRKLEAKWHADGQGAYRIEVAGAVEESSKGSASIVGRRADHAVPRLHAADAAAAQLQPRRCWCSSPGRWASPAWRARCCCWTGRSASSRCWA